MSKTTIDNLLSNCVLNKFTKYVKGSKKKSRMQLKSLIFNLHKVATIKIYDPTTPIEKLTQISKLLSLI